MHKKFEISTWIRITKTTNCLYNKEKGKGLLTTILFDNHDNDKIINNDSLVIASSATKTEPLIF